MWMYVELCSVHNFWSLLVIFHTIKQDQLKTQVDVYDTLFEFDLIKAKTCLKRKTDILIASHTCYNVLLL